MKVKFLTTYAGPTFTAAAGTVADVSSDLGKNLEAVGAVNVISGRPEVTVVIKRSKGKAAEAAGGDDQPPTPPEE